MDQLKRTYDFIIDYKRKNDGNSPTTQEIALGIGLRSKSGVPEYLNRLEAEGLIKRGGRGLAKNIVVVGSLWLGPTEAKVLIEEMEESMKRES